MSKFIIHYDIIKYIKISRKHLNCICIGVSSCYCVCKLFIFVDDRAILETLKLTEQTVVEERKLFLLDLFTKVAYVFRSTGLVSVS